MKKNKTGIPRIKLSNECVSNFGGPVKAFAETRPKLAKAEKTVVIEVLGGVATVRSAPKGIKVVIKDLD